MRNLIARLVCLLFGHREREIAILRNGFFGYACPRCWSISKRKPLGDATAEEELALEGIRRAWDFMSNALQRIRREP